MVKRVYANGTKSVAKKAKTTRKMSVPKNKFLLGNKVNTTLKYVHYGQLNPGAAGAAATYVFSANGLYDPDITGVGHQPRGFDQLIALYDHFHVTRSRIKVSFMASQAQAGAICGVVLQDDATPELDQIRGLENRYSYSKGLSYGNGTVEVFLNFNSKEFFNLNDRQLYGTVSANPTDQAYFVVFAQATYGTDLAAIDYMVELEYTTTFSEPNNVAAS